MGIGWWGGSGRDSTGFKRPLEFKIGESAKERAGEDEGELLKQDGRTLAAGDTSGGANISDIVLEAASKTETRGKYSLLWP